MDDSHTLVTQEQNAEQLGITLSQMTSLQNMGQSDDFQKQSIQKLQEQKSRQFYHQPLSELTPYSKLHLEEQQELKRLVESYQQESLHALKTIEQNTANLYTLIDLISKSNEQQDELISIIAEILSVAKAKSQNEAKSVFSKIMGRITQTVKDAETLAKVVGYAMSVWQLTQPIIEKLPVDKLPL